MATKNRRANGRRESGSDRRSGPVNWLIEAIGALYTQTAVAAVESKVRQTTAQWLGRAESDDGRHPEAVLLEAAALATHIEVITPSAMGILPFERAARRHNNDPAMAAALGALKRIRLTLVEFQGPGDGAFMFAVQDLVSKTPVSLHAGDLAPDYYGFTALVHLCPVGNDIEAVIGPVTPLDPGGLAVATDFIRPGKGISNGPRCAAAVFKHIVRHGRPEIGGVNDLYANMIRRMEQDDEDDEFEPSPVDMIAARIVLGKETHPLESEEIGEIRALANEDAVMEALIKAVTARAHAKTAPIADAYHKIAHLLIETLARRAEVGSGGGPKPLETIAGMIATAIANGDCSSGIRDVFEQIVHAVSASVKAKTQGDDSFRIIERIKALRAKTIDQGCTEEEALAAARKVAELLDRHGLSLSDIEIKQQTCVGVAIESGHKRSTPAEDCYPAIAAFFDCKVWLETNPDGTIRSVFFGLPADVEAALYLRERVTAAFETETKAFQKGTLYAESQGSERRLAKVSFQLGMSREINSKLREMKAGRDTTRCAGTGRDLVSVKTAVVDEELAKLGLALSRKKSGIRRIETEAYREGRVAGHKFEAQPGVE